MKKLLISLLLVISCVFAFSQEDTIDYDEGYLFNDDVNITGFGGPSFAMTKMNGDLALIMGVSGGILFNKNLFFGGYGTGITNKIPLDSTIYKGSYIGFSSGGLWAGYVFFNEKKFHPVLSCMFGWGNVSIANELGYINEIDNIYVVLPGLDLEMSISNYFKISAGVEYRSVFGINKLDFEDEDFSGFGGHVTLKFGWFGETTDELENE